MGSALGEERWGLGNGVNYLAGHKKATELVPRPLREVCPLACPQVLAVTLALSSLRAGALAWKGVLAVAVVSVWGLGTPRSELGRGFPSSVTAGSPGTAPSLGRTRSLSCGDRALQRGPRSVTSQPESLGGDAFPVPGVCAFLQTQLFAP